MRAPARRTSATAAASAPQFHTSSLARLGGAPGSAAASARTPA
eukprot:COSAG01_NODE_5550_length_4190_cov_48.559276_1_plen_42_part_10